MRIKNINLFILLLLVACVDPYPIEDSIAPDMLVVEGVLSSQLKKHQIFLSRATALNSKQTLPEQWASVTIKDDNGSTISLTESAPGIYETPEFAASAGRSYTLHINTYTGKKYSSKEVPFTDGPGIGDVYAKYIDNPNGPGKGIQVYVDSETNTTGSYYYRWNYIETYEVHAPFPSNWIWTGGTNLEFRIDGIDTCFVTDTLRNIMLLTTKDFAQTKIEAFPLRFIDDQQHILRYKYSILVQQFSLSKDSYDYWENQRLLSEAQGSLSDLQPGSVKGNMFSVDDPDEEVIGYFDVGKVSEKRIFFSAITFYKDGMKMPRPFRNYCFEIQPVLLMQHELPERMPALSATMNIWEVAGMSPNILVTLYSKTCTDCRDQGPTQRPDFW
jgi:hypothetical protein